MEIAESKIQGIDYLRAIMSIFVVAWHMEGGGQSLIFSKEEYTLHVFTFSDFINFHILLLGVPTFILISNFLMDMKRTESYHFGKRIKRILLLISFWPIAFIVAKGGMNGLFHIIPYSPKTLFFFLLQAGNTIYYYFVCLLFTIVFTYIIGNQRMLVIVACFILSIILLFFMPIITKSLSFYPLSAFWNPLNFLPYCSGAILINRFSNWISSKRPHTVFILILLAVVFSFIEWNIDTGSIFFPGQGYAIPAYTRVSLFFASSAILIIALNSTIRSHTIVRFMSKHSLGLYCLHPFIMHPVKQMLSVYAGPTQILLYLSILVVILTSYLMSIILGSYLKEGLL